MNISDIKDHISFLCPSWEQDLITDIEYISTGYSNRNYAFNFSNEPHILRIPERTQPFADYLHEATWFDRLPDAHFSKPIVYDIETGRMINQKINGLLLADFFTQTSDRSLLIDYVSSLHNHLPLCDRDYPTDRLLKEYGLKNKSNLSTKVELRACHNDLNPWNVIVSETKWETIDWEFAGNNDPLFDLVTLHQGLNLPFNELYELALKFEDGCQTNRIQANIKNYWLREFGWAKHQIKNGNGRSEIQEQYDQAQEMLELV